MFRFGFALSMMGWGLLIVGFVNAAFMFGLGVCFDWFTVILG